MLLPAWDLRTQLTIDLLNYWLGRCNDLKSAAAIKTAADLIRKMEGRTATTPSTGDSGSAAQ
jgi:hypothetical protein